VSASEAPEEALSLPSFISFPGTDTHLLTSVATIGRYGL
jgi:hypothetical protein